MSTAVPARPPTRLAADVAKPLPLTEPARLKLAPGLGVRAFYEALAADPGLAEDAVRFLAAALPKREAVWWGLACLRETLPAPFPEPVLRALMAVEKWVKEPAEGTRRAAGAAADEAGYGTPAGCLAAAAFWSGGSLTPANLPPVPPRDDLTALAVAGALLLGAAVEPLKGDATRARYLAVGQLVSGGQLKW